METHAVILYPENGQRGASGDCRFLTILSDWSAHLLGAGTVRVHLRLVWGDKSLRSAKKSGKTGRGE
jgi:histidine ammonia-lyase